MGDWDSFHKACITGISNHRFFKPEIVKLKGNEKMVIETLVVVDNNGDEHHFTEDDEHDYFYKYGRDDKDFSTNEYELRIYTNAGLDYKEKNLSSTILVASFFHPRYIKIIYEY